MFDTIYIYVPTFNQIVRISEGTGDNLLDEDIEAGYVDYIYYEQLEFEGDKYNSFTNSYSLVLTKESCGEISMCDEPNRYPDVTRLVHRAGDLETVNFNKVLAEAKSKGYKYSKNAIHNNDYLMKYNDSYFRIGLVDITYGVIDEGEEIDVYFNGKNRPITIENDLGIGIILPIRTDGELEGSIIVEI